MEITMSTRLPPQWATARPLEEYETQFLYTGLSRVDTVKQVISQLVKSPEGRITYTESPCESTVFPRVYASEWVQVRIFSRSPRVWTETLGVDIVHAFVQHPIQTDLT